MCENVIMKPITLHNSQVLINKKEINIKLQNNVSSERKMWTQNIQKVINDRLGEGDIPY